MLINDEPHILVVDDEPHIRQVLSTCLSAQGYLIRCAEDGESALSVMREWPPDIVITDLGMPGMGGVELCQRIREHSQAPIIVLSVRQKEQEKVEALDAGADDYVTKPFQTQELLARVRAQARRLSPQPASNTFIDVGHFRIDLETHSVQVNGRDIHLTPKEFEVLVYLAQHPGKVITHRKLLAAVWGDTSMEQPQYLHVFIGHLRKKLTPEGQTTQYIITEPWIGYRFVPGD
jgi:two-component system KDP operon response regulator KdpE